MRNAISPRLAINIFSSISGGLSPISLYDEQYLVKFDQARKARMKHFLVQLTPDQHQVVESAIKKFLPQASREQNASPNLRGTAFYLICQEVMNQEETT